MEVAVKLFNDVKFTTKVFVNESVFLIVVLELLLSDETFFSIFDDFGELLNVELVPCGGVNVLFVAVGVMLL